jgi:hypothetical protein
MGVQKMLESKGLSKKVKAVLGRMCHLRFFDSLQFKMSKRATTLLKVSEAFTTKLCSQCGRCSPPGLSRVFRCFNYRCQFVCGRDENAAINIAKFAFLRLSTISKKLHNSSIQTESGEECYDELCKKFSNFRKTSVSGIKIE